MAAAMLLQSVGSVAGAKFAHCVSQIQEPQKLLEQPSNPRHPFSATLTTRACAISRVCCTAQTTHSTAVHGGVTKDERSQLSNTESKAMELTEGRENDGNCDLHKDSSSATQNRDQSDAEESEGGGSQQANAMMHGHGLLGLGAVSSLLFAEQAHAEEPGEVLKNTQLVISSVAGIFAGAIGEFTLRGLFAKKFTERVMEALLELPESEKGRTLLANLGFVTLDQSIVAGKTKTIFTENWNALLENEATIALVEKRASAFIKELNIVKDVVEIKNALPATEYRFQALERSLAEMKADNNEIKASLHELKLSIDRLGQQP